MPPTEVDAIKEDLAELKTEVRESLKGIHTDLKELANALHELIRLDGDIGRVADMTHRIGKEVDDLFRLFRTEFGKLDTRLRTVETAQAGNTKSVGLFDSLVKYGMSLLMGAALGVTVVKVIS